MNKKTSFMPLIFIFLFFLINNCARIDKKILPDWPDNNVETKSMPVNKTEEPAGGFLLQRVDKIVDERNENNFRLIKSLTGHSKDVVSAAFSADGKMLASGSSDKTIKLWNVEGKKLITNLKGDNSFINSLAFSPDGKILASGNSDNTVKLWDIKNKKLITTLKGHNSYVMSVSFSPDGKTLASGSKDKTVKLWSVKTKKNIKTFKGHKYPVVSVKFSPDGRSLASAGYDETVKLWSVNTKKLITSLKVDNNWNNNWFFSVAFSPDGKILAAAGYKKIILWNVTTKEIVDILKGHNDWVCSVEFSPDGKILASGSWDKKINLWSVKTKKIIKRLTGHSDYVNSLAFSYDGEMLASAGRDKTIKLWKRDGKDMNPYVTIRNKVEKRLNDYLYMPEIPLVPKTNLPTVEHIEKDVFETKAMFNVRIDKIKEIRNRQVAKVMDYFRDEVEKRNRRIAEQKKEIEKRRIRIHIKQREFAIEAIKEAFGSPELVPVLVNGSPKYDAEKGIFYADLKMSGAKYEKEVKIRVPPGDEARIFYNKLQGGDLNPKAYYLFTDKNKIKLDRVIFKYNNKVHVAQEAGDNSFETEEPAIAVIDFFQIAKVKPEYEMQNPNIKDVEFEAYLIKEQGDFEDDIPQIFERIKASPIDSGKWLFVIGIEDYLETDQVNYSRRSAQWFKKVAAKTLGIEERRCYVLIDEKATSAGIKDRLKLMLRNVKKGDKIYFYYSGHGIPVYPERNPYILASDKIPDFVDDDDFFKVENVYKYLSGSNASQVVAFMDSCFTGNTDGRSVFRGDKGSARLKPRETGFDKKKMAVITAGTNKQFSNVFREKGHRLFSYYLMKSLLKGIKKIEQLHQDVYLNVRDASRKLGDMNFQDPVIEGNKNLEL
jgi:WD40 repeat protein